METMQIAAAESLLFNAHQGFYEHQTIKGASKPF
jgi:hypothetical protein